jgi:hypothetical protein
MLFYTNGLDPRSIADQAYLISLPVTFIKVFDRPTGKRWALEAKFNPVADGAIFYFAFSATFGLAGTPGAASHAGFLFPEMHVTDMAVHSA